MTAEIDIAIKGTTHYRTKLTPEDIRAIRSSTLLHREIAAQFGLRKESVSGLKRRVTWKHVI